MWFDGAGGAESCGAEPLEYPAVSLGANPLQPGDNWPLPPADESPEKKDGEKAAQKIELERAVAEAEARVRAACESVLEGERKALKAAIAEFHQGQKKYFEGVEPEVVQLALGIARRVLEREAQTDPLLLRGAVRVILEKLEDTSGIVLRTHPEQAAQWRKQFDLWELEPAPEVKEDATLPPGHYRLETRLGVTELGVEPQLKEIERGLLDLLAQRPGAEA